MPAYAYIHTFVYGYVHTYKVGKYSPTVADNECFYDLSQTNNVVHCNCIWNSLASLSFLPTL